MYRAKRKEVAPSGVAPILEAILGTVEPQWLEHLWDHGIRSFESIMVPVQEANSDNLGKSFRFSTQ